MSNRTMYITSVSYTLGDKWKWTKPCSTPMKSWKAGENMVVARILEDRRECRDFANFGQTIRNKFPEIIEIAQQFIGETREVILHDGEKPKDFQRRFHEVQYIPQEHEIVSTKKSETI